MTDHNMTDHDMTDQNITLHGLVIDHNTTCLLSPCVEWTLTIASTIKSSSICNSFDFSHGYIPTFLVRWDMVGQFGPIFLICAAIMKTRKRGAAPGVEKLTQFCLIAPSFQRDTTLQAGSAKSWKRRLNHVDEMAFGVEQLGRGLGSWWETRMALAASRLRRKQQPDWSQWAAGGPWVQSVLSGCRRPDFS